MVYDMYTVSDPSSLGSLKEEPLQGAFPVKANSNTKITVFPVRWLSRPFLRWSGLYAKNGSYTSVKAIATWCQI